MQLIRLLALGLILAGCGDEPTALYPVCPPGPVKTGNICLIEETPPEMDIPTIENATVIIVETPAVAVPAEVKPQPESHSCMLIQTAPDAPQGRSISSQGQRTGKWTMTNICTKTATISNFDLQDHASFACGEPCLMYLNAIYGRTAYGLWHLARQRGESRGYDGWLTIVRTLALEPGQTMILVSYEDTNGAREDDSLRVNLRNARWYDESGNHTLPAPREDWRMLTY